MSTGLAGASGPDMLVFIEIPELIAVLSEIAPTHGPNSGLLLDRRGYDLPGAVANRANLHRMMYYPPSRCLVTVKQEASALAATPEADRFVAQFQMQGSLYVTE